jgi:hypothetical protein
VARTLRHTGSSTHQRIADVLALNLESPSLVSVMFVLAYHWNATERASWPGVPLIVEETRFKERTVQVALRRLEALGHIGAMSSKKGGRSRSVKYYLYLPSANGAARAPFAETNGAARAPFPNPKGCNGEAERVQRKAVKGAPAAPEPSEPYKNRATDGGAAPEGAPLAGAEGRASDARSGSGPVCANDLRRTLRGATEGFSNPRPQPRAEDIANRIRQLLHVDLSPGDVVKALHQHGVTLEDVTRAERE